MGDIHQYKHFEQLVRRVGYSVGLEEPADRIHKLVDLYVREKEINISLWKLLVKDEYGRKVSDDLEATVWGGNRKSKKRLGAEDHFADFYSELNIIIRKNNQVFPLYGLEILSILRRYYDDDRKFKVALKAVVLLFILEADGDIFLNCILGNFKKEEVSKNLKSMFISKKQAYLDAYISPYSREKLLSVFKVQTSKSRESIFDKKQLENDEIVIPEDYISKIIPTRKNWAIQLGLFTENINETGNHLLSILENLCIHNGKFATFYCYPEIHKALFINEKNTDIKTISRKALMKSVFSSYINSSSNLVSGDPQNIDTYELLCEIMTLYKSANKVRGTIRHQLPLQIAFPIFYIISEFNKIEIDSLDSFIEEEQKSLKRRIDVLHMRADGMGGALSFRT